MGWARFDDRYSEHPKILAAGALAELLDMRAIIYCARNETDGKLARASLQRLAVGIPKPIQRAQKLVEVGRWEEVDDGWIVCDYLEYNPSKAEVDEARQARSDKARRAAQARWGQSPPDAQGNATSIPGAQPEQMLGDAPSRPVPKQLVNSSTDVVRESALGPVDDERFRTVIDRLTTKRINGIDRATINDLDRYTAKARRSVLEEHADRLCELLDRYPDGTVDQLAGALLGEPTSLGR